MKCNNCGYEIKENEKFCMNCGQAVSQTENEFPAENTTETVEAKTNELNETGVVEFDKTIQTNSDEVVIDKTPKNPMKKILLYSKISVFFIFIIALISCMFAVNSSTNKMKKALVSKQAYQVNSLYNEAYGNPSKIKKFDKCLSEFLDEVINDINSKVYMTSDLDENGYTVVYRDLQSDWGNLIYAENEDETIYSSISAYNQSKWDELWSLIKSRAAYCAGVCLLDTNHDPESAIDSFMKVLQTDNCYSSAMDSISACVDMYVEQTMTDVDKLIKDGDIGGAISKLDSINTYLADKGIETDDVKKKRDEALAEYAKAYCDKAETCFKEKDVDGAIGNIKAALEMQPDNADYQTKYDTYQQYLPFELFIEDNYLNIDETGDFWGNLGFGKNKKSNDNKEMKNSITWYNNSDDASVSMNVYYNLEAKYDIVTGIIYLPDSEKNTKFAGYFKVYGDGKLIYTSPKISSGVLPQDVKFNVTNIQKLKISFYGQGTGGWYSSGPTFGVSNLTAQKAFPKQ